MYDPKNNREFILVQLQRALQSDFPRRLLFSFCGPPLIEKAFIQPNPRLDILLSGQNDFILPSRQGVQKIRLTCGDAYYAQPHAWEYYEWKTDFELLCIVPRENYLRISYYRNDRNPVGIFYHTYRPCSEAFRHVTGALNSVSDLEDTPTGRFLALALLALALQECRQEPRQSHGKARTTFTQLCNWLENNIARDINRSAAATVFDLSPSYVSQIFTQMAGMGFHEYLSQKRIELAKNLVLGTHLTVAQISGQCGFKNPAHFGRRFRELVGISPGMYRLNQQRKGN